MISIVVIVTLLGAFVAAWRAISRANKKSLAALATAVCDPGSWRIEHSAQELMLSGAVQGQKFSYLSFVRGNSTYTNLLYLEHPVHVSISLGKRDDIPAEAFYFSSQLNDLRAFEDYDGLTTFPSKPSLWKELLSGDAPLGPTPGVLLETRRWQRFDPDLFRRDFNILLELLRTGL